MKYVVKVARQASIVALFIVAALLGTLSGVLFAYADDLPIITALDDYDPHTITRILGRNGAVVGDFAVERREVVTYQQIPENLRHAIVSAEDGGFFDHAGLSISKMVLALVMDLVAPGKTPGGSTVTQQLARNLFPSEIGFNIGDRSWERKVKESLVAMQIEKRYTKEEIFTMYCNQIYWGHGAYGVEAASQLYFGKSARDLSLEEAALIAGIIQGNVRQSPYVNLDAAMRRRNYALQRMADEGYITREVAEATRRKPIVTRGQPGQASSIAPYYIEEVRKYVEAKYGAKALYEKGLTIRTTLDADLQRAANRALDHGLRQVARRRGAWRKPARNILTEGHTLADFHHDRWARPAAPGDIVPAVVMSVDPRAARGATAQVRFGQFSAPLVRAGFQWTRRSHPADLVRPGDLIEVGVVTLDETSGTATVTLEQQPQIEGAIVALDNRTGQILAMVGGFSFARSKFNRATQAHRQMGSTFKPFLYTAAIDRGLTPTSILVDAPAAFNAGAGQPPYAPGNYDGKFEGAMTLRRALEQSRNIPAVRVMEMLGPQQVVSYARRFGFPETFPAYLSTALGAAESTLLEITSAYTAFPNQGIRLQPYQVTAVVDREGNVLEETRPAPREAIRADTAFVMTNLLRGVVQHGTAAAANRLKWPLAGKTGTVDDYTDAWFIGFDPNITVGVWVGYDEKKPIGSGETGGVTALPIWIDFIAEYIRLRGDREHPPDFEPPGNIIFVAVDYATGESPADPAAAISEAFISGTQPDKPPPPQ
ncbi:MAG: PBP1A family penicillin-binding protein [Acidobacteria bacterium]|nr:PBP1A family penicillin-binding protein [Acidobacteriota bacterium]